MENPYGDGHASEKIISALTSVALGEELLVKKSTRDKPNPQFVPKLD
jgi:hypothetical protein